MRCPHCGAENRERNRFCSNCGASLYEASAAPIFVLHPTALFVATRYLLAAILILGLLLLYTFVERARPGTIPAWGLLFAIAVILLSPISHHVARAFETYTLTEQGLTLTSGVLRRVHRHIPLSKIQEVTVVQSGWGRILGIGDLVIDTAAEAGRIVLRDVRHPKTYADLIIRQIERA
ncbi:MAG: PH domain-containing protein [Blastocatellia bacterium]|nr:PH domain-containing protein [Blastocatellia bacterium]MCS7156371.1 PH domain-containing protein [Blastocatellia bacterium]MCX7751278.1 PH domain-containing protein [Blastocatellia bacterium]MDW8168990.1 PH domain-containing protein [Acidobacteriota bacterium]MDW8256750.1 PH domain-containing protein [Acidobacteriota bacterium]